MSKISAVSKSAMSKSVMSTTSSSTRSGIFNSRTETEFWSLIEHHLANIIHIEDAREALKELITELGKIRNNDLEAMMPGYKKADRYGYIFNMFNVNKKANLMFRIVCYHLENDVDVDVENNYYWKIVSAMQEKLVTVRKEMKKLCNKREKEMFNHVSLEDVNFVLPEPDSLEDSSCADSRYRPPPAGKTGQVVANSEGTKTITKKKTPKTPIRRGSDSGDDTEIQANYTDIFRDVEELRQYVPRNFESKLDDIVVLLRDEKNECSEDILNEVREYMDTLRKRYMPKMTEETSTVSVETRLRDLLKR